MQNLAGHASGQSELMAVLCSAGLCEGASFHCLVQQRTGLSRNTVAKSFIAFRSERCTKSIWPIAFCYSYNYCKVQYLLINSFLTLICTPVITSLASGNEHKTEPSFA